jgi:hypothetical protein
MAVERIAVEEVPAAPRKAAKPKLETLETSSGPEPTLTPPPPPEPKIVYVERKREPDAADVTLMAARIIAMALSARALLFVALLGAIGLCAGVLAAPSVVRLLALASYAILTIIPLVWLDHVKGRGETRTITGEAP